MVHVLINCIIRIYLFYDYESLKHSLLKEKEKETPLLSRSFFLLSDKDKEVYASSFFKRIAKSDTKYDKNDLQILGEILLDIIQKILTKLLSKNLLKSTSIIVTKQKNFSFLN